MLDETALEPVHGLGLGVDLHANSAGCLIDEVDRLVRQLSVCDVAVRESRRSHDGRVGDIYRMVQFIALLQTAQNCYRVFDTRFVHQHFLKATLERGILLDVQAVFIERGCTNTVQLPTCKCRFEHVAGIHRAFRLARTHYGVQFVDEQHHVAFLLGQFFEYGLQAFFELAAEFGAGN